MKKQTDFECWICGGLCEEYEECNPSTGHEEIIWRHSDSKNEGHPPYPKLEFTKKEALKACIRLQKVIK